MLFIKKFSLLMRIFYISGLKPVATDEPNLKYIVDILPILLSPVIGIAIATYIGLFPHFDFVFVITTLINYSSLITNLLMILTANGQCYWYKHTYRSILNLIQQVENKYQEKSLRKLAIQSMALRFRLKVFFICLLFFLSQGLVFIEVWTININHLFSSFLTSFMRIAYPIQVIHFVLYCDILVMLIHRLNDVLKDSSPFLLSSKKIELLKHVKFIHMDLWKLVVLINNFFGWNLLFIIMYSFIYITYQVYWIFLTVHDKFDLLGLIESLASFSYGTVALLVLVNSCKSCSAEIKALIEKIERFTFWTTDTPLYQLKHDILSQIHNFPIYISASEFFTIDRAFMTAVAASCCMYIMIFIQFFQASETNKRVDVSQMLTNS